MDAFTAIDFETANGNPSSICQVGLVKVEQGIIVDEVCLLVQPPRNYYWGKFIDIHGITPVDTLQAPNFEEVWMQIEHFIKDQDVVAHNGFGFDFPVLKHTLAYYDIAEPRYSKYCTYRIYRRNLAYLSNKYGIELNHHNALSDAKACAQLFNLYLRNEM